MITGGGSSSSGGGKPSQGIQTVVSDDSFSGTRQLYLVGNPSRIVFRASIKNKLVVPEKFSKLNSEEAG